MSFNASCAVTGISIGYGDDVVLFLLRAANDSGEQLESVASGNFIYSVFQFFDLAFLPIRAKYLDNGQVFDIEPSPTTALIQSKFKEESIEDIVNGMLVATVLVGGIPIAPMFCLRDAYDMMVNADIGDRPSYAELGAEYDDKVGKFTERLRDYNRVISLEEDALRTASSAVETEEIEAYLSGLKKQDPLYYEKRGFTNFLLGKDRSLLFDTYYKQFMSGVIKEEVVNLALFSQALYMANKMFFPQVIGTQYGNDKLVDTIARFTKKKIGKNIEADELNGYPTYSNIEKAERLLEWLPFQDDLNNLQSSVLSQMKKDAGWSNTDIAKMLGVSRSMISRVISGDRFLKPEEIGLLISLWR